MSEILGEFCACIKDKLETFSFLHPEDFKELSGFLECKDVPSGKTIWQEGDTCDYVAFVISGRVEVKKDTEFKGKQIVIGIYNRGAIIGELCILDNSSRAVTAVALEDVSLVVITRENFGKLIKAKPELGVQLMRGMLLSVSKRLRKSIDRLAAIF
jgi:CRP-like cAMP-binding protein